MSHAGSTSGFTVLQWNARSVHSNGPEFSNYLSSLHKLPEVICIQETFLKPEHRFSLRGFSIERSDRQGGYGGVAIAVRNDVAYSNCRNIDGIEGIALTITNEKGSLEIINVYAPPNIELNKEIYKHIFSAQNALICGDFNAKSPLWGSPIPDSRGSFIVDVLESTNKVVLNTGEPTHFYNLGESHIDLTFSDPKYAHNASWQVLDESCGSDHYIIQID